MEDDGIPLMVTLREAAIALLLAHNSVRSMADSGTLRTVQPKGPNTKRFVTRSELERWEAIGWPVDWLALIDAVQE